MADVYENLETAVSNNCTESIIKNLKTILTNQNIEFNNTVLLKSLLKFDSNEIIKLTSQLIAESSKNVTNREKLSEKQLIEVLIQVFGTNKNVLSLTQVCRALGNICYENDEARKIMNENGATQKVISTLELCLSSDDASHTQLMKVTCGLLFNYLISNEEAQKEAIRLGILSIIEKIVDQKVGVFGTCEDLFIHLLHVLSVLTEQLVDSWFSNTLLCHLVTILELSINPEISEFCLDLLHGQAENDEIKLMLAKKGLCELLYNLLEQHKSLVADEESRALLKLACDLIVLILTGDQSMSLLYAEGSGKVYKDMLSWLKSDDVDLMITGVLAVGNFARNDKHCIRMVEDGLSETLLDILSKHNKVNDDIRLQHALLSALRNLVIPAQNKSRMISNGLVDIIYPMLTIEQYPVIFKLLGTLRMVIDGQEKTALQLISREDLLERLVDFCLNSDHPGVRAESPRLLAWLLKHCHSSQPYPSIIRVKNCMKCLVEMIPSSHAVMQNEALFALNLLCAYERINQENLTKDELAQDINNLNLDNGLENGFVSSDVGKYVAFLLNKYCDKMEKEVLENLLTLLEKLCGYSVVKENLKKNDVSVALKKCLDRKDLMVIYDRVIKIINSIDSG